MRKPRDFDAELKALGDKARDLKGRKVQQLGELIIATGADTLTTLELARTRQFPTHANQRKQPELDLMSISLSVNPDIVESNHRGTIGVKLDLDAVVDDPAVASSIAHGICEVFGRRQHVIEQAYLT
jgi:hypothetical protein